MMKYVKLYMALIIATVAIALPQDVHGMDFPYGLKRSSFYELPSPRPLKMLRRGNDFVVDIEGIILTNKSTEANLSEKKLTSLPPKLFTITALTKLNICYNYLTILPPEIGNLIGLTELNLSYSRLTALPPEISNLTALRMLGISHMYLTVFPPAIGNLTTLTELHCGENNLTIFPQEIFNLTRLTSLSLNEINLTILPPKLFNLTGLTRLDLDYNKLTTVAPEIANLTALKRLDLCVNLLKGSEAKWNKSMYGSSELDSFRLFCTVKAKIQMVLLANQYDKTSSLSVLFPDVIKLVCQIFINQYDLGESNKSLN